MPESNGNDGDLVLSVLDGSVQEPSGDHSDDSCFVTLPFIQKVPYPVPYFYHPYVSNHLFCMYQASTV